MKASVFDRLESEVRSYVRSFPTVFCQAQGCWLMDEAGKRYLDFFAGAGSLNYGHNHPALKSSLMTYLDADGIVQGLDMATGAKRAFMEAFERLILIPRQMSYKLQFTGPTGANAVEAALKIARQKKKSETVICFTNAFHGVSAGALAATGHKRFRQAAGAPLEYTRFMPYAGYFGSDVSTLAIIEKQLRDPGSGLDHPAAILVETVQGEGGLHSASRQWLRGLADLCKRHDMLLIIDDIQMGCGRTGSFFSFEDSGINPDIIVLSKSLSGYGLPMSLVLLKPQLDIWAPSAHNGTFRGNNAAFVTATAALTEFWRDEQFADHIEESSRVLRNRLRRLQRKQALISEVRGRGMAAGLVFDSGDLARRSAALCFQRGLIVETCGPSGEVLKLMPPLTIDEKDLNAGLDIIEACLKELQIELDASISREMLA